MTKRIIVFIFLTALLLTGFSVWGDEDLAQTFIKKGKKALRNKNYTDAQGFFEQALKEYDLPEILYYLGEAANKLNQEDKARSAWQNFINVYEAIDKPSHKLKTMYRRAKKALASLNRHQRALAQLEKGYTQKLIVFARRLSGKDNYSARKALETALVVSPDHTEATALIKELPEALPKIFSAARTDKEILDEQPKQPRLFNGKDLEGWELLSLKKWQVLASHLVCDSPGATELGYVNSPWFQKEFNVSLEFKLEEVYRADHFGFGLVLGRKNPDDLSIISFQPGARMKLLFRYKGKWHDDLKNSVLKRDLVKGVWYTFRLQVKDGDYFKATLNGQPCLEYKAHDNYFCAGNLGLWVQDCKVKTRQFEYQIIK